MITVLGIDPGISGALVLLREDNYFESFLMPTLSFSHKNKSGTEKIKKRVDANKLYPVLKNWFSSFLIENVYIEQQLVIRTQGVASIMTTIENYGILKGLLYSLKANIIEVSAISWQDVYYKKDTSLNFSDTKQMSIHYASSMFGQEALKSKNRKVDHNLSDAFLIANYGLNKELRKDI